MLCGCVEKICWRTSITTAEVLVPRTDHGPSNGFVNCLTGGRYILEQICYRNGSVLQCAQDRAP